MKKDGITSEQLMKKIENISDNEKAIAILRDESIQDIIDSKYEQLRNYLPEIGTFLGIEIGELTSKEQILATYQRLFDRYNDLNNPIDREELFDIIRTVYQQNFSENSVLQNVERRIKKTRENDEEFWNKENNAKIEKLKKVVYSFAGMAGIEDEKMCNDLIARLSKLNVNDSIDKLLVSLNSLLNRKVLSAEQILSNADLITALNPEKYKSPDDLINRLEWIKSMNMEYPQMPLTENHKLVKESIMLKEIQDQKIDMMLKLFKIM